MLLWGAYAFADGVLALGAAVSGTSGKPWWMLTLEGLVGLAAAAAAFFYPGLTAMVLLYVIAAWAILTGLLQLAAAIRLRKEIEGEFWLGLAGVASVAFGVLLIARPGAGALSVIFIIRALRHRLRRDAHRGRFPRQVAEAPGPRVVRGDGTHRRPVTCASRGAGAPGRPTPC